MLILSILCCATTYDCVAVSEFVCGWSPLRWVKTFNSPTQIYRFHPTRNSWMKNQPNSEYLMLPACGVGKGIGGCKMQWCWQHLSDFLGDEKRSIASMHCIYSITLASFKWQLISRVFILLWHFYVLQIGQVIISISLALLKPQTLMCWRLGLKVEL